MGVDTHLPDDFIKAEQKRRALEGKKCHARPARPGCTINKIFFLLLAWKLETCHNKLDSAWLGGGY